MIQRDLNLLRSRVTRVERGHIRRLVGKASPAAASRRELATQLELRPACLQGAMIWDVLGWARRLGGYAKGGSERARAVLLDQAGISNQCRLVGDLTDRQLMSLCAALRSDSRKVAA